MTPVLDPAIPRTVHLEAAGWNSIDAIRLATTTAIGRGLSVREVIGARRQVPGGPFTVALIVTGGKA